jgi:hypothetical protein
VSPHLCPFIYFSLNRKPKYSSSAGGDPFYHVNQLSHSAHFTWHSICMYNVHSTNVINFQFIQTGPINFQKQIFTIKVNQLSVLQTFSNGFYSADLQFGFILYIFTSGSCSPNFPTMTYVVYKFFP